MRWSRLGQFRRIMQTIQLKRVVSHSSYVAYIDVHCRQVNFARAARTDAGVHAAGNLVSLKMITTIPGIPDMVARINEELPPEIRAWGFVCRSPLSIPAIMTNICRSEFKTPSMPVCELCLYALNPFAGLTRVSQSLRQPQVYLLLPIVYADTSETWVRPP